MGKFLYLIGYLLLLTSCLGNGSSSSSSSNSSSNECLTGSIQVNSPSETSAYLSIQEAVQAANPNDQILVGSGFYNEIVRIENKQNVALTSNCRAHILGVKVVNSSDIKIEGFKIGSKNSNTHAVLLGASEWLWKSSSDAISSDDSSQNVRISIFNNEITSTSDMPAVVLRGGLQDITVEKNYIHHNDSAGLVLFPSGAISGTHTIRGNLIYQNGLNGVMVRGNLTKHKFHFSGNRIAENGVKKPNSKDSYGLKIIEASKELSFVFIDNVISFNNGKIENNSTKDIYHYSEVFGQDDSNNQTTSGIEGNGVIVYTDGIPPQIQITSQGEIRTNNPTYMLQALITDESPVTSLIYVNNVLVATSSDYQINQSVQLSEGLNNIQIVAKDSFNNESSAGISNILLDTIPAKISTTDPVENSVFYTNSLPYSFNLNVTVDEDIVSGKINNLLGVMLGARQFGTFALLSQEGTNSVQIESTDLAGNVGTETKSFQLVYDITAPTVEIGLTNNTTVNQTSISIPIHVTETSPVETSIYINNIKVHSSSELNFSASLILGSEGENTFEIEAIDAAGNKSERKSVTVIRDTTPPVLSNLNPTSGSNIRYMTFQASGSSNEALAYVKLNGAMLNISSDKLSFSGNYVANQFGVQSFNYEYADLYGNVGTFNFSARILGSVLNLALIRVVPDPGGRYFWIIGSDSATRPGATVRVFENLFSTNRDSTTADSNGAFQMKLTYFEAATIIAIDTVYDESAEGVINFYRETTLTGIVKDINNVPLSNVKIGVSGSASTVFSDGNGVFVFNNPPTGDQTLVVDASTTPQPSSGPNRQFAVTKVAVNIGVGQNNSLSAPVYLTPLLLDGTETQIAAGSGATVTSPNAPGVQIDVPSGASVFPDGSNTGSINMIAVPAERATTKVPANFIPTKVVSLEPSGLSFTERVSISLPNDNELPAGTEMVILSMNSSKGQWEVDGLAKVSDDGQSVQTKPGLGISHFSTVYAVPLAPLIAAVKNPNLVGIDVNQGALSTSVKLPSFKVLGQDVTPSLVYKSTWANPTALVSNIFEIPYQKVESTLSGGYVTNEGRDFTKWTCLDSTGLLCVNLSGHYYLHTEYSFNAQVTNMYVPDSVRSQFFVSRVASDAVTTNNTVLDSQIAQLQGSTISNAVATQILEQTGIPNRAVISYAVELIDPGTGLHLESGIYPALARYEIKLKNLTITTNTYNLYRTATTYVLGLVQHDILENTVERVDTRIDTRLIDLLPQDLTTNLLVQNKVNSKAGRGWHVAGAQRIVNPNNAKIMIEEASGEVSTYAINNTITTLFDANGTNVDLSNGVDLSFWPKALVPSFDASRTSYVSQIDLSAQTSNLTNIGILPSISGKVANQGFASCDQYYGCDLLGCRYFYTGQFNTSTHDYVTKFRPGGLVQAANGDIYLTNNLEHSLYRFNGMSSKILGVNANVDDAIFALNNNTGYFNQKLENVNGECTKLFGFECSNPIQGTAHNCDSANDRQEGHWHETGFWFLGFWIHTGWNWHWHILQSKTIKFANSQGQMGVTSSAELGMNNPTYIIGTPDGRIIFSDTGNNRVRAYYPQTGFVETIAGNGQINDTQENALATQTSLFHPKGLAMDDVGNLYVALEKGYIKRIAPNGVISSFAGKPLSLGGVVGDEVPANRVFINSPEGLSFDRVNQVLYVADGGGHKVFRISLQTGIASSVVGSGQCVQGDIGDGSPALLASLCKPTHLGLDDRNNLVIVDSGHSRIRRVNFISPSSGSLAYAPSNKDLSRLLKNNDGTWYRQYRNGNYDYFNQYGLQTRSVDRVGRQTVFEYNSDKNLTRVTFPDGQSLLYDYSGNYLSQIIDPAGRATTLNFTGNLLLSANFPDGSSRRFTYDSKGQMTSETDQRNNLTEYTYNEWNRLRQVIKPDGKTVTLNDIASQTVANNFTGGQIGSMKSPGLGEDQVSNQLTDSRNITTSMRQDFMGFISQIKDAKGNITSIERDLDGKPTKITRPDGSTTTMTYDPATRDLLKTRDDGLQIEESKTYNQFGQVVTETNGKGQSIIKTYDAGTGLLLQIQYPLGNVEAFSYNSKGQVTQKIIANGATNILTTYEYDSLGRVSRVIDNGGKFTRFIYDQAGNKTQSISTSNGTDQLVTKYEYDVFNRLTKVTSPKNEVTQYQYFATGELFKIIDPKNNVTQFEYDAMGRLAKKTDPLGKIYQFSYDGNGNRVQEIDPNGNVKTYSYNELNQMIQANFPDDSVVYQYDQKGEVIFAANSVSQVDVVKDSKNRVTWTRMLGAGSMSDFPLIEMNYSYDNADNRVLLQSSIGNIGYSYDSNNRLSGIQNSWGDSFGFGYDLAGRLLQISRPGGSTNYSYTASGALEMIQHIGNGSIKSFAQYTYDQRNFPVQKRTVAGDYNYSFDSNGQLTSATHPSLPGETFQYDSLGNRTQDEARAYGYDSKGQRLLDDGVYLYQYDNNGNVTHQLNKDSSKEGFVFQYSSKNQLIRTQILDGTYGPVKREINYVYDVLGRRMQKAVMDFTAPSDPIKTYTKRFVYDGQNIFAEFDGSNNLLARYTHNPLTLDDVLSASVTASGVAQGIAQMSGNFYYLKDHLGSITEVISAAGNILQKYDYRSFGKIISIKDDSGADISSNPVLRTSFTYTGREFEEDTGLFYYRARYLSAATGRFLQADPDPGSVSGPITVNNKYAYAGNNALLFKDPKGSIFGIDDVLFLILASGVIGSIDASSRGENILLGFLKGIAVGFITYVAYLLAPESNLFGFLEKSNKLIGFGLTTIPTAINAGSKGGSFVENFFNASLGGETILAAALSWMGETGRRVVNADIAMSTDLLEKFALNSLKIGTYFVQYAPGFSHVCGSDRGDSRCR